MRREWSAKARAVVLINVPLRSVPNLVNKSNYLSFVPYPQIVQLYPCFQMAEDGWTQGVCQEAKERSNYRRL
jgi:hypothetical protein